jgi:C-terminal regulatory domain of Threonine dehydratase
MTSVPPPPRPPALDIAKVLAGIQVPQAKHEQFQKFLGDLGYQYKEETSNVVYRTFLAEEDGDE